MKLDLLNRKWLDIVFEGKNKNYGAYELRKTNDKTSIKGFFIGALIFGLAMATPKIVEWIGDASSDDSANNNKKIVTIKLPPKEEKIKEDLKPPPPPPPKVDVVKFVKPVVAKQDEVTEEPPKVKELEKVTVGKEDIKGDPDAAITLAPVGDGPKEVVAEDNNIYNSAGIEVKPEYPGGIDKFRAFIGSKFTAPEDEEFKGGAVIVGFVVEKDGNLTDVKVLRDCGYGTGKEALRVFGLSKTRWTPAQQNDKKVRCSYQISIRINSAGE